MLKALWVAATVQRCIKQPGDEWCQQAAKFFHDPRRNWVQQAGFVRRPADQSNDLVELNLGQMVYKTVCSSLLVVGRGNAATVAARTVSTFSLKNFANSSADNEEHVAHSSRH